MRDNLVLNFVKICLLCQKLKDMQSCRSLQITNSYPHFLTEMLVLSSVPFYVKQILAALNGTFVSVLNSTPYHKSLWKIEGMTPQILKAVTNDHIHTVPTGKQHPVPQGAWWAPETFRLPWIRHILPSLRHELR